jgi:SPP1 family holin
MGLDKGTVARGIVFVLAWVNSFLASKGYKTIPVLDQATVAMLIAFGVSVYTFYKHNIFGKKGKALKDAIVKESEVVIDKVVNSKQAEDLVAKVVNTQPVTTPQAPVVNSTVEQPVTKVEVPAQPTDNNQTK